MRTDEQDWHFILNPAAGRGRAARRWERMLPTLRAALPGMTLATSSPEVSLGELAERAVAAGHCRIVGVGGDGSHHQVLNGLVRSGRLSEVIYAPLSLGTGNDWVRTLGTPRALAAWLSRLQAGVTISHRIGELHYATPQGPQITHFLNVAGLAYDAVVVRRSERARFKHRFIYPFLTLAYLRDFRPPTVRIIYDGQTFTGPVHTINLGIGRYNGGGMRLVPQAEPTAPRLALTFARELPLTTILAQSWRFYTGTIGAVPGVTLTQATHVTIEVLDGQLELEADGEWLGSGPVTTSLLAETLAVVV